MRIAIDLPEYVEFSDDDLIEEVIVCLKTIKVGSAAEYLAHRYGGGGTVIYIHRYLSIFKFISPLLPV